jgi:hypothetical protein
MVTAGTTPEKVNEIEPSRPGHLPDYVAVAGSHRHVHLIDAGIHVRDRTVHAPAALCADKVYETIQALKFRLDRDLLTSCRNT